MSTLAEFCNEFIIQKHPGALGAYFYGSAKEGRQNKYSDLDLIVVYPDPISTYREKIRWNDWLFDTFVYDVEALYGAMILARSNGNSVIAHSIKNSEILSTTLTPELTSIKRIAESVAAAAPLPRSLQNQRQLLTGMIDDLRGLEDPHEKTFVLADVLQSLIDIVMSKYGEMGSTKRYAARLLREKDPQLFEMISKSYTEAINGNVDEFLNIAQATLLIAGGELREGFRLKLPESLRIPII